jgi:hypothetical protein
LQLANRLPLPADQLAVQAGRDRRLNIGQIIIMAVHNRLPR